MVIYFPQEFTIEDVLAEYDLDKDEFISLSEFIGDVRGEGKMTDDSLKKKILVSVCYSSCQPLNSVNTFFVSLCPGESPSQWEIEETVRFKELYDQDKDGRLNRGEQLRWVAPNSYGSAREEVSLACILTWDSKDQLSIINKR